MIGIAFVSTSYTKIWKEGQFKYIQYMCGSRGRIAPPPPPPEKSQKYIGFLGNTGRDPLKFSKFPKLQSQHSMLGQHRQAAKHHLNGFGWWADDGQLLVVFGSPLLKKKKKNVVRVAELDHRVSELDL